MGSPNPVAAALASAHKALDDANKFTRSVTGGKPNAFAPKETPHTDYSVVRSARKGAEEGPKEFMGIKSDQSAELNAAQKNREDAKKALEQ